MKITNMRLVNIANTLEYYMKKKLPQKISYAITKNMIVVSSEYKIYNEQLQKLFADFDEHIEKDEEGNMKVNGNGIPLVDKSVSEDFYKELSDLLNIVVDVNFYYIDQEVFDYEDNDRYDPLSAADIINLQAIICKPEENKKEKD